MKLNTRPAVYAIVAVAVSCFSPDTRSSSNPGPDIYDGRSLIVDGTTDSDGDGRVGDAEDNDGDNVFSTLAAALAVPVQSGARIITIIGPGVYNPPDLGSAGLFGETAASVPDGTTIQAAPGVFAVLDGHAASDGRTVSLGLRVTGRVTLRGIVSAICHWNRSGAKCPGGDGERRVGEQPRVGSCNRNWFPCDYERLLGACERVVSQVRVGSTGASSRWGRSIQQERFRLH